MTLPDERYRAVLETQRFLLEILITPRVPKAVKDQARRCLRHYPSGHDMRQTASQCPDIFQERMEPVNRWVQSGIQEKQNEA